MNPNLKQLLRKAKIYKSLKRAAYRILRRDDQLDRWERLLEFFSTLVTPGVLCFDVGANRGEITEILLALGARVVAVEPNPELVGFLNRHLECQDCRVVGAAVSSSGGIADLYLGDSDLVSTLSVEFQQTLQARSDAWCRDRRWDRKIQIKTVTVDDLIEQFGKPEFLKVDTEGWEHEVFNGLSYPVALVSLEFHRDALDPALQAVRRLELLGEYLFNYSFGDHYHLHQWQDSASVFNDILSQPYPEPYGDIYARLIRAKTSPSDIGAG